MHCIASMIVNNPTFSIIYNKLQLTLSSQLLPNYQDQKVPNYQVFIQFLFHALITMLSFSNSRGELSFFGFYVELFVTRVSIFCFLGHVFSTLAMLRTININFIQVHSRLGYYFWDKGIHDFVALDLDVYYNLL